MDAGVEATSIPTKLFTSLVSYLFIPLWSTSLGTCQEREANRNVTGLDYDTRKEHDVEDCNLKPMYT